MFRFGKTIALALTLVTVPAAALAASSSGPVAGTWRRTPTAPFAVMAGQAGVWTGKELLVVGWPPSPQGTLADAAAAYNPSTSTWTRLPVPPKTDNYCRRSAVWTGKEMVAWGCGQLVFNPATRRWRRLPPAPTGQGVAVWTGREVVGWGGGCCGDASSDGSAYKPSTNSWRKLAKSPLAPSQQPLGVWTGREVLIFVSRFDPEGKPWPARYARAAAYNPAADSWRRLAPMMQSDLRFGGPAIWDGREALVVSAGSSSKSTFAYGPATNGWRRLAAMPSSRVGPAAVWTGSRLFVWGGQNADASRYLGDGVAYDPGSNRWASIARAPLPASGGTAVVWTGRSLMVWGGVVPSSGAGNPTRYLREGAIFAPATP